MVMRSKSTKGRAGGNDMTSGKGIDAGRRSLLALTASAPFLLLGLGQRAEAQDGACVDPNTLPANQKSMRRSLGFKLQAPDPKKRCGNCAFFTPSSSGCGKCALLSGGIVAAGSVCDSWAAKG